MARAEKREELLAQAREARANRAHGLGTVMVAAGFLLVAVVVVLAFALDFRRSRESGSSSNIRTGLLVPAGVLVSGLLLVRGRRLRAKGAEYALTTDERPPIVYLRPFESDRAAPVPSLRSRTRLRARRSGIGLRSYEQDLAALLDGIAPFVTIGDPTERLPELGAARLYASDEEWRATVDELLARGGPVILHAGDSPGVAWEVERIVALGQPERVILSLPLPVHRDGRSREERYADFRCLFDASFPRGLPERAGDTQFVYFTADWTPRRLEGRGAVPEPVLGSPGEHRALVLRKLAPAFKRMWAPLWLRGLAYCAVAVALFALVLKAGGDGGDAQARVATCEASIATDLVALGAPERSAFTSGDAASRRDAATTCRDLDAGHDLDARGRLATTAPARLHACSMLWRPALAAIDWGSAGLGTPSRAWLTELARRYCKRIRVDSNDAAVSLTNAQSQRLFAALAQQLVRERPSR